MKFHSMLMLACRVSYLDSGDRKSVDASERLEAIRGSSERNNELVGLAMQIVRAAPMIGLLLLFLLISGLGRLAR